MRIFGSTLADVTDGLRVCADEVLRRNEADALFRRGGGRAGGGEDRRTLGRMIDSGGTGIGATTVEDPLDGLKKMGLGVVPPLLLVLGVGLLVAAGLADFFPPETGRLLPVSAVAWFEALLWVANDRLLSGEGGRIVTGR